MRSGCEQLLADCAAQGTLTACIGPEPPPADLAGIPAALLPFPHVPVLDPEDPISYFQALSKARLACSLTPDGFGGSDGFGARPNGAEREPLPQYCVVLVTTLSECDGALRAGMRTVGLPGDEGEWLADELEGIADACLDDLADIPDGLDELSTPGSFWLNPCLPRDTQGMAVNPETGLRYGMDLEPQQETEQEQ